MKNIKIRETRTREYVVEVPEPIDPISVVNWIQDNDDIKDEISPDVLLHDELGSVEIINGEAGDEPDFALRLDEDGYLEVDEL